MNNLSCYIIGQYIHLKALCQFLKLYLQKSALTFVKRKSLCDKEHSILHIFSHILSFIFCKNKIIPQLYISEQKISIS